MGSDKFNKLENELGHLCTVIQESDLPERDAHCELILSVMDELARFSLFLDKHEELERDLASWTDPMWQNGFGE